MNRLLEKLESPLRKRLKRASMPKWTAPMLATLTDKRFSDPRWIFERKLDGERCLAFRDGRGARLMSRNRKRLDDVYPELVEALKVASKASFVADGEVVAFEGAVTSFARLQGRMQVSDAEQARKTGIAVYFYLFDLLHLDGYDLTRLPLQARKQLLRNALPFEDLLRFTAHRREHGEKYYAEACRKGFGALLVGFYRGKTLHYAGKVGTGYDDRTLESLRAELDKREQNDCPFAESKTAREKGVHWVEPALVAQIGFTEWTRDDRLRHPRFLGLRRDKPARNVRKETPR